MHDYDFPIPSSRAADITRLLDPSYNPASSTLRPAAVYVDHRGTPHDPDYRHFAPVRIPRHRIPPRPAVFDDDSDASDSSSLSDLDDDPASPFNPLSSTTSSSSYSPRRTRRRRTPPPASPYRAPAFFDYDSSPPTSLESTSALASSPSSPFDDEKKCSSVSAVLMPRRCARARAARASLDEQRRASFDDDDIPDAYRDDPAEKPALHDDAPTCAQGLRRQWQALSLSVRFGVFRAQRKVRRRMSGGGGT